MPITLKDGRIIRMVAPRVSEDRRSLHQRGAMQEVNTGLIAWPAKRMTKEKICRECSKRLPITAFSKDRKSRDKLKSYCKTCAAEYNRAWRDRRRGGPPQKGYRKDWFNGRPGPHTKD